ncbi:MAG: hypothetical protein EXR91_02720 [Gemmatimonadetes bacterium]|nr:hypothetical protein [Gemmatimonadota bacterium]
MMLHEHLFYPSGDLRYNTNEVSFPPLYLAGGVTTMRTGGSVDTYTDLRVRQDVEEGRIPGPHMDVTGPYLEGPNGFVRAMPQLATPEQARAFVNFWADQGVTSFKAYNLISRATLGAAIEAAHARGLEVTGHLCSITYREAADLGIDNLEHGFFAATDWVLGKRPDECPEGADLRYLDIDLESAEFTDVVDHLIARGVALTSTLTVVERRAPNRPAPPAGAQRAMLPQLRDQVMASLLVWAGGLRTIDATLDNQGSLTVAPGAAHSLQITGSLVTNGVVNLEIGGLTAGTLYDRLAVTGAVTLGGTLNIGLINAFVPTIGDAFTVMTYASRSGSFTTPNLPVIPIGTWGVGTGPTTLVLSVN